MLTGGLKTLTYWKFGGAGDMQKSQLKGKVENIIEKAKSCVWVTVSGIDDCGTKLITQLSARGVNVKLLVSKRVSWDVIQRLPNVAGLKHILS
jgi:hypothetical protein